VRVLVVILVRTETHDRLTAIGARIIRGGDQPIAGAGRLRLRLRVRSRSLAGPGHRPAPAASRHVGSTAAMRPTDN